MSTAPPNGPRSERANTIFRHLYRSQSYEYVEPNYDRNIDGFRDKVNAMFHPDGLNLLLSVRLFDLQREIESYSGSGYATKRATIRTLYAALLANERQEVRTQNQWRVLVDNRFERAVERRQILNDLHIP